MYAVIHGGIDPDLRQKSCEVLSKLPFDGFAIGGSMGKTKDQMIGMLGEIRDLLKAQPIQGTIVSYHDKFSIGPRPKKRKRRRKPTKRSAAQNMNRQSTQKTRASWNTSKNRGSIRYSLKRQMPTLLQ